MANTERTALIVGASRGLGLALAAEYLRRGWRVVATERGPSAGLRALSSDRLEIETLDVLDQDQIAAVRTRLDGRRIDLLFVNAGVSGGASDRVAAISTADFNRVMLTNTLAPMRVVTAFESLVPATGAIVAMSSSLGSVAENESGGWEVYRGSKAALNTLMRSFAASHAGDKRTLLLINPGWVRTDMGGAGAALSIEQSIPRVVDTITKATGTPGLQFLDYRGETVRW